MPTEPDADTLRAAALRQPAEARARFLEAACNRQRVQILN